MTLAEIETNLPNGFHDAEIEELVWNYRTDSASFTMKLWVPEATDQDIEIYRLGRLDVKEIVFMAIDPPHPRDLDPKPCKPSGVLQIDGVATTETIFPGLSKLKQQLPSQAQIYSFYVVNWNSYIHIAAGEAELVWIGEREMMGKK
jgi:hypothetical protein